jgi:hypothetical protein
VPRNAVVDLLPESLVCKEPVYHYTSAHGLLGIVEKHALRATEAFGLNDVAELRHGWRFVKQWLDDQTGEEPVDEMGKHLPDDDEGLDDAVFMCCASTMHDDASQWRLYADATRGYAIKLDPSVELSVLARMDAFPNGKPPEVYNSKVVGALLRDFAEVTPWMHVMDTDVQKAEALDFFRASLGRRFAEYTAWMSAAATEEDHDKLRQDRNGEVRSGLAILTQCMKAEAFAGENEVRAVVTLLFDEHCCFRPHLLRRCQVR